MLTNCRQLARDQQGEFDISNCDENTTSTPGKQA